MASRRRGVSGEQPPGDGDTKGVEMALVLVLTLEGVEWRPK
jgi:hypothetical protein